MADLRQTTDVLDDFMRPDEFPIQNTPAHPWVTPFISPDPVQLKGHSLTGWAPSNYGHLARWNGDPYPQSRSAGITPEVWGRVVPSYTFPEGTRQALMTSNGSGYAVLFTGGFGLTVRRYTNGSVDMDITNYSIAGDSQATPPGGNLQLMRLTATDMECWYTQFADFTTWYLSCRVPLNAGGGQVYVDGMYGCLGTTGNEDGWDWFGGKPRIKTQIYRYVSN